MEAVKLIRLKNLVKCEETSPQVVDEWGLEKFNFSRRGLKIRSKCFD